VQNHINDLVVFTDVFGGEWEKLVDDFREEENIAARVAANTSYKFGERILVLNDMNRLSQSQEYRHAPGGCLPD
jgi:hypothetical protein